MDDLYAAYDDSDMVDDDVEAEYDAYIEVA